MARLVLHEGDCLEVLGRLPEAHFDAIVTDPPYHLTSIVKRFGGAGAAAARPGTDGLFQRSSRGFMGKTWDGGDIAFRVETWAAALRVLKPGGHLVAFSAARTYHHMALAIELAGFEMRDALLSLYSASLAWRDFLDGLAPEQVGALARAAAASDAPLLAWLYGCGFPKSHDVAKAIDKALTGVTRGAAGAPVEGDVKRSFGQHYSRTEKGDPITPEAQEWEGWGTALKPAWEPIVLARKPLAEGSVARQHMATGTGGLNIDAARLGGGEERKICGTGAGQGTDTHMAGFVGIEPRQTTEGRWPANMVHDGSQEVMMRFPVDAGASSARFFYSAKADARDRAGSDHPTVKPQALMRWLVRLTTPRGGKVLDMFGGSGSTGWAAATEGRACDLIERDPGYAAHIRARLADFGPDHLPDPGADAEPAPRRDLFGG